MSKKSTAAVINPALAPLVRPISELRLDPKNTRHHGDRSVEAIKQSLSVHGQQKPIVALQDGTVIAGNGTLSAALQLGWNKLAVVTFDTKDEARARAFAITDNRSAELSAWDSGALLAALTNLPQDLLPSVGFSEEEIAELVELKMPEDTQYTRKIETPIYEPKGDKPSVASLFDSVKTTELQRDIDAAALPKDIAHFLRLAAERHTVFNFHRIADFYAHSDAATQRLFERSALVIVDFDQAVESGFVKLTNEIASQYGRDYGDSNAE